MKKSQIFRTIALERLASPEQLDQILQVTNRRGWLALGSLGLLLSTAILWGIFGVLAEKVSGSGILIRSGGVLEVVATAGGRVNDVAVSVGDRIVQGQVVARVEQPELLDQLDEARAKLRLATDQRAETVALLTEKAKLERTRLEQERSSASAGISADRARLGTIEERLSVQSRLVEDGLLAKPTLLATRQLRDQTLEKIRAQETTLSSLRVQELEIDNQLQDAMRSGQVSIDKSAAEVARLERRLSDSSRVVSRYGGRVLEVMTEQGKIVQRGEPVLTLDLEGGEVQDLVAIVYVPSVDGKKVKPGMRIFLAPSTVPQEEFGMMLGAVTFVSDFPATTRGMVQVLKNEALVRELTGGGAPYEVHAELIVDPTTPTQYRWTSSTGPQTRIESGTLAAGFIRTQTQRPISKVIPLLRKWTGVS